MDKFDDMDINVKALEILSKNFDINENICKVVTNNPELGHVIIEIDDNYRLYLKNILEEYGGWTNGDMPMLLLAPYRLYAPAILGLGILTIFIIRMFAG